MDIKISLDGETIDITPEELRYGLNAIIDKRNRYSSLKLSSDEMEFSELFKVARKLNQYAEQEDMNITIIAIDSN